jgi:hypothetical protein
LERFPSSFKSAQLHPLPSPTLPPPTPARTSQLQQRAPAILHFKTQFKVRMSCKPGRMQRTDVDLRAIAGSGKDASQKMEDALERLLRNAASGADNCKHFESIVSCCESSKYSPAIRSCAFSLIPSCALYEGDAWGKLVQAAISEVAPLWLWFAHALTPPLQVNAACSGATGSERTAASAVRALASVPCVWLQAHTYDLCDALRDAASRHASTLHQPPRTSAPLMFSVLF